jgi:hypothetical protein
MISYFKSSFLFASLVILTHSSAQDSFLEAQLVDEEFIVAGTIP